MTNGNDDCGTRPVRTNISCVVFDAVGTLIRPNPPVATAYSQIGHRFGSVRSEAEVAQRFSAAFQQAEANDLAREPGTRWTTSEEYERHRWRGIVRAVLDDVPDQDGCFDALFRHFGQPDSWICFNDVPGAIDWCEQSGLGLAVASNFDRRLDAVLDGQPELKRIRCRVISSVVGFRKPGHRFYETVIKQTGYASQEILMVGDDWKNDVEAARQAGLNAIHLQRKPPPANGAIASLNQLRDNCQENGLLTGNPI